MKVGILKIFFIALAFVFFTMSLFSQEKVTLENLEPTFEEETDVKSIEGEKSISKIKSKNKKRSTTNETIVNIRALDKITAKTSDIDIIVGQKKKFGYLEILPKKCAKSQTEREKGVVVYMQVKDLSDKKGDKIFVFNGWTFSSSPTLKTFDHPVYDLWVMGCENI